MNKKVSTYQKIVSLMTLFSVAGLTGCFPADKEVTSEDVKVTVEKSNDTIVVGLYDKYPPLEFRGTSGQLMGYDVDLAREVFKRLDKKVIFAPIQWSKRDNELFEKKSIDVIWSGMSSNAKRKKKYLMTDPYLQKTGSVVVLANSPIKSEQGLIGKKVVYPDGYSVGKVFQTYIKQKNITVKLDTVSEAVEGLTNLLEGKSDAAVSDSIEMEYYVANSSGKFRILKTELPFTDVAIALRKEDTELHSAINTQLSAIKADGTYEKIKSKWFGSK